MFPYIPNNKHDEKFMLDSLGIQSMDELFADIPADVKLNRDLAIGSPMSELELTSHVKDLASKNQGSEQFTCFLGAGAYDHYIPSIIDHITSRSEFYTAYTPYQPEISQGTLQVIFEYQTMITNLTGMDVANASIYDGATACAEASMMSVDNTKRKTIVVSKTVHPEVRKVLKTYMDFKDMNILEVDHRDGVTDIEKLRLAVDGNIAGVVLQSPNFFGVIEDLTEAEKIIHQNKSMFIMYTDPIALSILKSPREIGADIVVGEGQVLGNSLSYGGPYLGFMAATSKLMRKMPGRIVGQTEDVDGKRGFVLTLQTREQHIRRHKATSNICSNQALNALRAAVYLITMGKEGLREVAQQCVQKSHYAMEQLTKDGKYTLAFNKPFFREFVIKSEVDGELVNQKLLDNKIIGGYHLNKDYGYQNHLMFSVTEKRTKEEIDNLAKTMEVIG
jgi:glycine dehydrogenase subunit 1